MSATFAPSPWPASPPAPRMPQAGWMFGREVVLRHLPGAPRALQWLLPRPATFTPRQLARAYVAAAGVALAVAAGFLANGMPSVLAFTAAGLLAAGLALRASLRHAGDRETLTLVGRQLQVERCIGRRVERTEFAADLLRVEPAAGQGSLVELSGRGQRLRVGRFLRPELRASFARELRQALRRGVAPTPDTTRTEAFPR